MVTEITWTSIGGKLWVNVRSCCVNKTHCFSLPAEATHEYNCRLFFFISMENSPFFKKNLGLIFRVLAATVYDNTSLSR